VDALYLAKAPSVLSFRCEDKVSDERNTLRQGTLLWRHQKCGRTYRIAITWPTCHADTICANNKL